MSQVEELLSCIEEVRRAFGPNGDPRALEACNQLENLFLPHAARRTRKKAESVEKPKSQEVKRGRGRQAKVKKDENDPPEVRQSARKRSLPKVEVAKAISSDDGTGATKAKTKSSSNANVPTISATKSKLKLTPKASPDTPETKTKSAIKADIPTSNVPEAKTKSSEGVSVTNTTKTKPNRNVSTGTPKPKPKPISNPEESFLSTTISTTVEKRNRKGETQLHACCTKPNFNRIQELLVAGADPNTKDFAGWTPLLEVAASGSIEIVKLLLDYGAYPDTPGPMNNTPLHEAVRCGHANVAKLLVEKGANTCVKNAKGITPLQMANDDIKLVLSEALRNKTDYVPQLKSILDAEINVQLKIFPLLMKENMKKLKALAAKHNLVIDTNFNQETSFVLVDDVDDYGSCHPNLTVLNSIVLGTPIIKADWLLECNNSKLSPLKNYEVAAVAGIYDSIHNSYVNKLKLFPPLFNGCHFYFLNLNGMYEISSYLKVNKEILSKLVKDGGGVVLKREPDPEAIPEDEQILPYHAPKGGVLENCSHFIIYRFPPKLAYNMKHLKSLPVGWLIDCIQNFKIVDP